MSVYTDIGQARAEGLSDGAAGAGHCAGAEYSAGCRIYVGGDAVSGPDTLLLWRQ